MDFIEVSGTSYEMGKSQGQKLKSLINSTVRILSESQIINKLVPDYNLKKVIIKGVQKVSGVLGLSILARDSKYMDRIRGIANGADIDINVIIFWQMLEIILDQPLYTFGPCTTIALLDRYYKGNGPVILKNFDYIKDFSEFNIVRKSNPDRGYRSIEVTMGQLAGSHVGMNEAGLAFSYNYGLSKEVIRGRLPYTLLFQRMMEKYDNVIDAVNYLLDLKFSHSAILTLADTKGNLKILELSPDHKGIREPVDNKYSIASNFFLTKKMRPYDLPHNTYFSSVVPEINGIRIHESNEKRYLRAEDLLSAKKSIDLKYAIKIMKDHGKNNIANDNTICRHSNFFNTMASVILMPVDKKIMYYLGNPCEVKKFKTINLDW